MTDTSTHALLNPAAADLGAHAPKPTATTPGMTEASLVLWTNGRVETGLWESNAGSFVAKREGYSEICTFVSGEATITATGEEPITYRAGDMVAMPSGWVGVWDVPVAVRKHYTTIND